VKSRNSSQCNETLLVMTVRPGKKFGFQSAAENLQWRGRPDRLWQTVPDWCSSHWKGAVIILQRFSTRATTSLADVAVTHIENIMRSSIAQISKQLDLTCSQYVYHHHNHPTDLAVSSVASVLLNNMYS